MKKEIYIPFKYYNQNVQRNFLLELKKSLPGLTFGLWHPSEKRISMPANHAIGRVTGQDG